MGLEPDYRNKFVQRLTMHDKEFITRIVTYIAFLSFNFFLNRPIYIYENLIAIADLQLLRYIEVFHIFVLFLYFLLYMTNSIVHEFNFTSKHDFYVNILIILIFNISFCFRYINEIFIIIKIIKKRVCGTF